MLSRLVSHLRFQSPAKQIRDEKNSIALLDSVPNTILIRDQAFYWAVKSKHWNKGGLYWQFYLHSKQPMRTHDRLGTRLFPSDFVKFFGSARSLSLKGNMLHSLFSSKELQLQQVLLRECFCFIIPAEPSGPSSCLMTRISPHAQITSLQMGLRYIESIDYFCN